MIHIGYFSNQFASSKGHGIARYAHHLYNVLLQNKASLTLHPVSASTNATLEEIDALKSRTGLQVLPWGRKVTPLAWIFFNFPSFSQHLRMHREYQQEDQQSKYR